LFSTRKEFDLILEMEYWFLLSCLTAVCALLARRHFFGKNAIPRGEGKAALVTGAAGGIGRATVFKLLAKGWTVICCDVDSEGLKKLQQDTLETVNGNQRVITKHLDVSRKESRDALYKFIADFCRERSIDALISIAGIIQAQPQASLSEEEIELIFEINALGPMKMMNSLIPYLLKNDSGGSISIVTSLNARTSFLGIGAYPATKHALLGWANTLRREAKQNGLPLRVSMIEPGSVSTPIATTLADRQLRWCEGNQCSPWLQGIFRSASSFSNAIKKGMKVEWVSVSPSEVAGIILESVSVSNPKPSYIRAAFPLLLVFYIDLYSPTYIGDALLALL